MKQYLIWKLTKVFEEPYLLVCSCFLFIFYYIVLIYTVGVLFLLFVHVLLIVVVEEKWKYLWKLEIRMFIHHERVDFHWKFGFRISRNITLKSLI